MLLAPACGLVVVNLAQAWHLASENAVAGQHCAVIGLAIKRSLLLDFVCMGHAAVPIAKDSAPCLQQHCDPLLTRVPLTCHDDRDRDDSPSATAVTAAVILHLVARNIIIPQVDPQGSSPPVYICAAYRTAPVLAWLGPKPQNAPKRLFHRSTISNPICSGRLF